VSGFVDWVHLDQCRVWWRTPIKNGNEPSRFVKCGESLGQLSDHQVLKSLLVMLLNDALSAADVNSVAW